jgi:ATP synthase protein I
LPGFERRLRKISQAHIFLRVTNGAKGQPGGGANEPPRKKAPEADVSGLAGLGVQFAAAVVLFLFVGKWLDDRLGTGPWLLIVGVFAGAAGATVSMYRKLFPPEPRPPKQ